MSDSIANSTSTTPADTVTPHGFVAGEEFLVNTTTRNSQVDSSVTGLSGGGFVVTWSDFSESADDNSASAVRGQQFSASGAKVGSEFLVNTTTPYDQDEPSVTGLSGGGFVVTWQDGWGQQFSANGFKVGSEFRVNTATRNGQYEPSVTGLSGGGFVVVWRDGSFSADDDSDWAVRGQQFSANGAKLGSEFLVNTTTRNGQYQPSVTGLSDGGFVVTWSDYSLSADDNSGYAVRGQQFSANGAKLGSEFLVNTTTRIDQDESSVTGLSGGGFVVTWTDGSFSADDNSGYAVRGQQFSANGAKLGSEFLVNTTTRNSQVESSVTGLSGGGFVVTWTDLSRSADDNSGYAVRGQQFSANGTKVGSEFLVNTTTSGRQDEPSVTGLSGGGFVVTWTDYSLSADDNSGYAVRGRVFGSDAALVPMTDNIPADASTSSALTLNTSNGSTIDGVGDQDWFRISLTAGTAYTFHQDQASGSSLNPYLRVFNSGGTVVAENSGSSSATLTFTPTLTSTYYVSAGGSGASTGAYTLSGTAVDAILASTATTANLTLNTSNGSTIDGAGDQDWFRISLTSGTAYTFHQDRASGSALDPYLRVFNSGGTELAESIGTSGSATLTFTPTLTSTYYVSAGGSGASTGAYSITVPRPAAEIFRDVGRLGVEEAVNFDTFNVGKLRVLADFSKAAYNLQEWEKNTNFNDPNPQANEAYETIIQQGWMPLNLMPKTSNAAMVAGDGAAYDMENGFYTNGNAAAFVAVYNDSAIISFRGTNDNSPSGNTEDPNNEIHPDKDDWAHMGLHYSLLMPLINKFDEFVSENNIRNVYVTGHSLGGAMAVNYMETHAGDKYSGVTFAAPPFVNNPTNILNYPNDRDRLIQVEIIADAVPYINTAAESTSAAVVVSLINMVDSFIPLSDLFPDINLPEDRPGKVVSLDGDKTSSISIFSEYNSNHSMDYYRHITKSIDAFGWQEILTRQADTVVKFGGLTAYDTFIVDGRSSATGNLIPGLEDDNLVAYGGSDIVFYGGLGEDIFTGGGGGELMLGGAGNDIIHGNGGKDKIYPGSGNDVVYGGVGDDTIWGGSGDFDLLFGDDGNDAIYGESGTAILIGGLGSDVLSGGAGVDGFGFITPYEEMDTITDFQVGEDKIVFLGANFGIEDFDVVNLLSIRNRPDENPTFIFELETGILYFDSNLFAFDHTSALALLVGVTHLSKEDFLLL